MPRKGLVDQVEEQVKEERPVERSVTVACGPIDLEGLMAPVAGRPGAVVTHPHSLFGGDMRNDVVSAIVDAYREQGYGTLRFNFRGAGGSGGEHDDGRGEQEDVEAALGVLAGEGATAIDLAGYSFGAWVNASGPGRFGRAGRLVMVAPPVKMFDFSILKGNPRLALVVLGSRDEFAPLESVQKLMPRWSPGAELAVIEGADHFFRGRTAELKGRLRQFLQGAPA